MEITSNMISTKTIICRSNLVLAIEDIYKHLSPGKRDYIDEPFQIEMVYYQNSVKHMESVIPKKKKQSFRNSLNIVVNLNGKKINFKTSKNGKFQLTGCRSEEQALKCIQYFVTICLKECHDYITALDECAFFEFQTVMTNIDFDIGFPVNRQRLDEIMNQETIYKSLFETSFGYTGVNIKFPVNLEDIMMCHYSAQFKMIDGISGWTPTIAHSKYSSFLKKKTKYNTFLVFHSGKVIMSGMTAESMKTDLNCFLDLVRSWKNRIEETIS